MTSKVLPLDFFNRNAKVVARDLLGKFLVRKVGGKEISVMITETEAYDGPHDLASHASKGRTKRTEIMFGYPSTLYVYLIYGVYEMLNIVTGEKDYPAAVLIRRVEGFMGPGKVTKFLHINRSLNGKVLGKSTGLWIEDGGVDISKSHIKALPRVGVAYAGPIWSAKKLRFVIDEKRNPFNKFRASQ